MYLVGLRMLCTRPPLHMPGPFGELASVVRATFFAFGLRNMHMQVGFETTQYANRKNCRRIMQQTFRDPSNAAFATTGAAESVS